MSTTSTTIGHLRELVRALDRRRPQPDRPGEAAVVRAAAALRRRALARLAALEARRRCSSGRCATSC